MEVFGISASGITVPSPGSLPDRGRQERRSVAVLPFINMSADPENAYFSDGISEELINLLTRVNGLQVTARTSSFAFKDKQADVREIAKQLGVGMVLEGSVRKAGDRVRVTAQLIDAATGFHLFSENYDRQLADIFELQDELARTIVNTVQDRLQPERSIISSWDARFDRLATFLASQRTSNEAHAHYLHALYEYNKWTPEALNRAIRLLERCLAEDPDYAPAHAALSRSHGFLSSTGQAEVEEGWRRAETAARRAVELDPNLPEAHVALGTSELFYRWDMKSANVHLQKGISLGPGSAIARQAFGMYAIVTGDSERAIEEMEIAVRSDPLSMLILYSLGWAFLEAGRASDAIELCDRILETDPMFRAAHEGKGLAFMQLGRLDEAAACFERVVQITGDPYKGLAPRGVNFAFMGRTEEARRTLSMLHERRQRNPHLSLEVDFAMVHAALGEFDQAFPFLEEAADKRLAEVLFSVNSSMWKEVRKDSRYWDIITRHGLLPVARDRPPDARPR
jgi:TolB-like protein/Flp pilus assembly protein TadD